MRIYDPDLESSKESNSEMSNSRRINPAVVNKTPYDEAEGIATEEPKRGTMEDTEKAINKDRRRCTISSNITDLLVTQLRAELSNYNLYNTFASYYSRIGLMKMAEYFKARADEENLHHRWIRDYLMWCGAEFQYPQVPPISVDVKDEVQPLKDTVDREIETTGGINFIANQAMKENDWATFSFLHGTSSDEFGKLIPEQVEEEHISRNALHIGMREDADWLAKQDAIYDLYFGIRGNNKEDDD